MNMKTRNAILFFLVLAIGAAGAAIVKVRAQSIVIQPFTAIQVGEAIAGAGHGPMIQNVPQSAQPPAPFVYTKLIAVRSDGSFATATAWAQDKTKFIRDVVDNSAKIHVTVEPITETILTVNFHDEQTIQPGYCEGKPAGQLEGFDVLLVEDPVENVFDGSLLYRKKWNAPKLGCYPLAEEWTDIHNGEMMFDTKHTVTHIKLGEPDPWYFEVPTTYTKRTKDEWWPLMLPHLNQPAP